MSEQTNENVYSQGRQDMESKLLPKIDALQQENKDLHEQIAALESKEVCNAPHDDGVIKGCPFCEIERIKGTVRRAAKRVVCDDKETT